MSEESVDQFYEELSERIKDCRLRKNISLTHMADYLHLAKSTVSNIETGRHRPSIHHLVIMAKVMNVEISDLIPSQKDPTQSPTSKIKTALKEKKVVTDDKTKVDKPTQDILLAFLSSVKK